VKKNLLVEQLIEAFSPKVIPPEAESITSLLCLRVAAMAEQGRLAGTLLLCGGIRVQGLSLTLQSFHRRSKPVAKVSSTERHGVYTRDSSVNGGQKKTGPH